MSNEINLTWEEVSSMCYKAIRICDNLKEIHRLHAIFDFVNPKSGPINIVEEEKKQKKCPLCGCEEICYITKFGEPDDRCSNCNADWPIKSRCSYMFGIVNGGGQCTNTATHRIYDILVCKEHSEGYAEAEEL